MVAHRCYGEPVTGSEDTARLEALWAGEFGDDYVDRNFEADAGREPFWRERIEQLGATSALEIGCNVGGNLVWIAKRIGEEHVAGIEINEKAVEVCRERLPAADIRHAGAKGLPFDDGSFDLVFTVGVLIHQPREELDGIIDEIVRVSKRFVLCVEYHSDELVEVPYRGQEGALFKEDYGRRYKQRYPELELVDQGFLARSEVTSWDDVTWHVFRKPSA